MYKHIQKKKTADSRVTPSFYILTQLNFGLCVNLIAATEPWLMTEQTTNSSTRASSLNKKAIISQSNMSITFLFMVLLSHHEGGAEKIMAAVCVCVWARALHQPQTECVPGRRRAALCLCFYFGLCLSAIFSSFFLAHRANAGAVRRERRRAFSISF